MSCNHSTTVRMWEVVNKDECPICLRSRLAFAEDAAAKGDLARLTAGGMEMEIAELRPRLAESERHREKNRKTALGYKSRLAAAEADAKRYRWLRKWWGLVTTFYSRSGRRVDSIMLNDDKPLGFKPANIDSAIDAHLAGAGEEAGRDAGDFDYPPGFAPCMCQFSTTCMDADAPPASECYYHQHLRSRLAAVEALASARDESIKLLAIDLEFYQERLAAAKSNEKLYWELIYAVASKYPGESRHDTALRYIRDRETLPSLGPSAAGAGGET